MTERCSGAGFLATMRVIVVAGVAGGVVLVGLGSRLAMMLLRVTSPDHVRGIESDDGFTIGELTLAGTYNLLNLGAAVGIIGACVYRLVAPWLIGPRWFRRVTTGAAAGVVGSSMLIHADGIDFTALGPLWLAIALFIALPAVFGALIGVLVDSVADDASWTNRGRRRIVLPTVLVALFPFSLFVLVPVTVAVAASMLLGSLSFVHRVRSGMGFGLAVRAAWLGIAVLGSVALAGDIRALT